MAETQIAQPVTIYEDLKTAGVTEIEIVPSSSEVSEDEESTSTSSAEQDEDVKQEDTEWIVSSPYPDQAHQLDLNTLSEDVADFARALTIMDAARDDYATAPYHLAFNWDTVVSKFLQIRTKSDETTLRFFVIVFRSRLKIDADRPLLGILDKAAHREAIEAGGLLKYWFGSPDSNRRNLATCLWRARSDARLGGAGPGHASAMMAARKMYDEWFVERLELSIETATATWKFAPWPDLE